MPKAYYAIGITVLIGIIIIWYYARILIYDEDRIISFGRGKHSKRRITINLDDHFDRPWSTILMLGFASTVLIILAIIVRLLLNTI